MLVLKNQLFEKTEENVAGLAEKRKELIILRREIEAKRQKLDESAAQLQKECTHEVVADWDNLQRSCHICAFREYWNPGVGFEKLGKPLIILPEEMAKTFVTGQFDEFIRKQEKMPEFLKKYFGE